MPVSLCEAFMESLEHPIVGFRNILIVGDFNYTQFAVEPKCNWLVVSM